MKFILLILISFAVCSFSILTKRRSKRQVTGAYDRAKQSFIAAATAADGIYIEQSWRQSEFIQSNSAKLQQIITNLNRDGPNANNPTKNTREAGPKAASILGLDVSNLQERIQGICAGMSIYFLNMMKVAKEQTPANQANQRAMNEITLMGNENIQTSFYMNALELHNLYYTSSDIKQIAALKNLIFEGPAQSTSIARGMTSSIGTVTKDVDLEKQARDIQDWLKAHHRSHSYITFETRKHAMAYARVGGDLKFFFDPNFGVVMFHSISKIGKFFEAFLNIAELKNGYMPNGITDIRLNAFK